MKNGWFSLLIMVLLSACGKNPDEQVCFHAVVDDFTETITVNGNIEAVNTTSLMSPRIFLSTIIWLVEDGKEIQKGDTVCILEHPEISNRLESLLEQMEDLDAQLEKLHADHQVKLSMLHAEIENNNIRLSINSLDSIQKKFAPPLQQKLITLEQKKANIFKEKLEKKYTAQKTIGETEIRGLNSRVRQLENQIQRTRDELKQLIITTPMEGKVLRVEVPTRYFMSSQGFGTIGGKLTEGSLALPNMKILEIPDMSKMQVIAELSENNYKRTEEGQKVIIRVDVKDNLVTTGVIKRKMLAGKQQNRDSKVKIYEALIEIDSCHTRLNPGLNAACEIILNELSDTLVIPAIAVFQEDEKKFVFVREGKKFRKTFVETGTLNSTYNVIASGLPADSYIALGRPPGGKIIREREGRSVADSGFISLPEQPVPAPDSILQSN
ncbi:MAG: efflux RND transporter periplasmic adaptor subunit [Bacteroidales bacterium]